MSANGVRIVTHSFDELALFNVHGFHAEPIFFLLKLIVHDFLQTHALVIQQSDEAIVLAPIGHNMVAINAVVVDVQLVENAVGWSPHFHGQIHRNVLETQITETNKKARQKLLEFKTYFYFAAKKPKWRKFGRIAKKEFVFETYQEMSTGVLPL